MGAYGTATHIPLSKAEREGKAMARQLNKASALAHDAASTLHYSEHRHVGRAEAMELISAAQKALARAALLLS